MTEPTPTEDTPTPSQEIPFRECVGLSDDALSVEVSKAINLEQLEQELQAAGATRVVVQVPVDLGSVLEASNDKPVTLYVEGIKTKKAINEVVAAHNADPQFGLSDEQKADAAVIAKVQDVNATLTSDDLAAALRVLLKPAQIGVPA